MQSQQQKCVLAREVHEYIYTHRLLQVQHALNEIFDRLDSDMSGYLYPNTLRTFLRLTENWSPEGGGGVNTDSIFDWVLNKFGTKNGNRFGLTKLDFRELYLWMYEQGPKLNPPSSNANKYFPSFAQKKPTRDSRPWPKMVRFASLFIKISPLSKCAKINF